MAEFEFPWEYNFPPFFTIQPHAKTLEKQLATWKSLVLGYQKCKNQALLSLSDDSPLFTNATLNRSLPLEGRILVLDELNKTGNASPTDKRSKLDWEIYWFTLEEWANLIHGWAVANGMTNTVCTFYEITSEEQAAGQEFQNLDERVLLKVLRVLEGRGKCEVFDNNEGVKFF